MVQDSLHPIRIKFVGTLPGHCRVFLNALEGHRALSRIINTSEVSSSAHKIAGVAETLGFKQMGDLAAQLEEACGQTSNIAGPKGAQHTAELISALLLEIAPVLDRTWPRRKGEPEEPVSASRPRN